MGDYVRGCQGGATKGTESAKIDQGILAREKREMTRKKIRT